MGGQKKTATESQTDTFQELVVLLVGSDVKFVVVPFQNLLGIGKDWGDEFLSCFHSMPINVSMPIYRDDVLGIVERLGIAIRHARKNLEEEEVKVFIGYSVCRLFTNGNQPFYLVFGEMWAFALLTTFVLEAVVWILFDKPQTEGFADVTLESFVIIVDGCLTTFNELACRCVSLFFTNCLLYTSPSPRD